MLQIKYHHLITCNWRNFCAKIEAILLPTQRSDHTKRKRKKKFLEKSIQPSLRSESKTIFSFTAG